MLGRRNARSFEPAPVPNKTVFFRSTPRGAGIRIVCPTEQKSLSAACLYAAERIRVHGSERQRQVFSTPVRHCSSPTGQKQQEQKWYNRSLLRPNGVAKPQPMWRQRRTVQSGINRWQRHERPLLRSGRIAMRRWKAERRGRSGLSGLLPHMKRRSAQNRQRRSVAAGTCCRVCTPSVSGEVRSTVGVNGGGVTPR